jgi:hypothetical protein
MTIDPIVALPAVASIAVISTVSVEAALFRIYLPILMLLPDSYYWGWPPLNFHQYALVPIGFALCWWVLNGKWKTSVIDIAVFSFIIWMVVSDLHASQGTTDIANRLTGPLTLALFPYMAGKLLIQQTGRGVAFAKRLIALLVFDVLISVYEFRFSVNPFRAFLGRFFSTVDPWFTQVRYGFGRIAGPFGHAIFMGSILVMAILLHRYLMHFGFWEQRFRRFPRLPLNKPRVIMAILVAGSLMTISRGPWLAAVVGLMLATIGVARNRYRAFSSVVLILTLGGGLIYFGAKAYVAGAKADENKEEVASAEYRTRLLDEYSDIAMQRSFWGWGSVFWPRVQGMASIDNWYLLLALMYGVTGVVLFLLMMGVAILQLFWVGMRDVNLAMDQRALIFTLGASIVAVGVSVGSVFLGGQLFPLLFLFIGWGDACLAYRPRYALAPITTSAFSFRRVIA